MISYSSKKSLNFFTKSSFKMRGIFRNICRSLLNSSEFFCPTILNEVHNAVIFQLSENKHFKHFFMRLNPWNPSFQTNKQKRRNMFQLMRGSHCRTGNSFFLLSFFFLVHPLSSVIQSSKSKKRDKYLRLFTVLCGIHNSCSKYKNDTRRRTHWRSLTTNIQRHFGTKYQFVPTLILF